MGGTDRSKVATRSLQLRLLGAPRLILPEAEHALERRDAALLALLVIDGPTPRARAAALIWPDADDEHARNNLRQRLFRLNRLAGRDIVVPEGVLRLAPEVEHDLSTLSDRSAIDPETGAGELLGKLDYADCSELAEWVQVARERWRSARRDALAEAASRFESEGQIARALLYAERLVADDPLHEHAHRRLMRLHYLRGDRGAALAAFERCREVLESELGAAPGRETLDIAALIESSSPLPGTAPKPAGPAPLAVLRPPRIVGREAEWRAIERACAESRVVLVCGEPGIGKTRLLTDFANSQPRASVFGARPGDARVPYSLLARLLRGLAETRGAPWGDWVRGELARLVPELGAAPGRALEPLRLRQAVAEAFGLWCGDSTLLVVDDLQFADEASLELLSNLAGPGTLRANWLLGTRTSEIPAAIANWLAADAEADAPLRIDLGPLSMPAIEALLESLAIPGLDAAGLAGPLARHTGGNPMFILETLRALLARGSTQINPSARLPAPANIGQLIERRLTQLSPAALKLARVAALAGQDFGADLSAAVLRQHPLDLSEAWSELEAAQVIRDNGFAHDLIFEATLHSVPPAIAAVMHGAIASFLEARNGAPARIAHHWLAASEWHKAATQFNAAARASFNASRYPEAGALFLRAAECFERAGAEPEQHTALQEVAGCLLKAFDLIGAREVAEQLQRIALDEAQRGWALDRLIDILNMSRADDRAAETAAMQMRQCGVATDQPWMVFNATRKLAVTLAHQNRFDDALALLDSQSAWIDRNLHEWNVHVWFCDHAYVLDLADRRDDAIAAYRRAETLARKHENWSVVYAALRNLALVQSWAGNLTHAARYSDEAVLFSGRLGDALVERNPRDASRRAAVLRDVGRFSEALALLRAAHADLLRGGSPYWLAYCADQLALLYAIVGQPGRARELLAASPPQSPPEAYVSRWLAQSRVARAGNWTVPRWDDSIDAAVKDLACPARWRLLALLERTYQGETADALSWCRQVEAEARERELDGIRLHALARAAAIAADSGKRAAAGDWSRRAESLVNRCSPTGMTAAEFFWCTHRGLDLAGESDEALLALKRAVEWIEQSALPNVPDEFCDSFLNRNPVNRAVITLASRRHR